MAVLVGGDEDVLEKARPVIESFAASIIRFGESGAGQHAKVVNQIMVAGTMLGLATYSGEIFMLVVSIMIQLMMNRVM